MIKIEATVVVSDMRNFTGISEEFEKRGSDYFMKFMERYYELHTLIAKEISSEDLYINSKILRKFKIHIISKMDNISIIVL